MLNYIKSQIKAQRAAVENSSDKPFVESNNDEVSNDVILEYAKLFQELDDLTEEGTDEGLERKLGMDIPLEDDVEVENIEFDLNDGKVADIPGDATVAESYSTMKTLDMFVQEVMESTPRLSRESDSMYNNRITKIANKLYEEYCVDAEETGQFGFDRISVGDDRIPTKAIINFGQIDESSDNMFMMKMPVTFATDEDHKITKKQLDSFGFVKNGAFTNIGKPLMQYMESNYVIPEKSTLWDIVTPTGLYIPKGNGDSFCVVLEYMNEITNKKEYFGWTRSVRNDEKSDIDYNEKINMESFVEESSWEDHDNYLINTEKEERRRRMRKPLKRNIFQEAIDFGGGDDAGGGDASADTSGGDDLPPAPDSDGGGDTSTDAGSSEGSSDASADTSDGGGDDKETAAVNNVSADIAKEVADNTKEDADNTDVTFDDDMGDADSSDDTESDLDELENDGLLDDEDTDDMDGTDEDGIDGEVDFDTMTINDMLEEGSEKLKSMTLSEIKDFISSGNKEEIQEAFILTSKNINKEVDVNLRKCLGILNDANMNVDKIFKTFKLSGHKLNRVLTKAARNSRVYSSDEQEEIKKLNSALSDLLSSLKITNKSSYVASVKQKITKFIDQSKVVAAFVEDKMEGKAIQEAFIQEGLFLTTSNAKKSLSKKMKLVITDLESIVSASEKGKFTRGKLIKMYQSKSDKFKVSHDYEGTRIGTDYDYEINTSAMKNMDNLSHLIEKILKRKKVQSAFNASEINKLNQINDEISEYVDFIETILADSADDNTMKQFVTDTKKLLDLLKGFDSTTAPEKDNEKLTDNVKEEDKKENENNAKGDE